MPSGSIRTLAAAAAAGALVAALVLGAVVLFLRDDGNVPIEVNLPTPEPAEGAAPSNAGDPDDELRVYVSGEVHRPGVYTLRPGDRLEDALAAAGGPTANAALTSLNLAVRVQDEGHYHVPDVAAQGAVGPTPASEQAQSSDSGGGEGCGGLIDLNTASADMLETLPQIGRVRAASIVSYREQTGPFQSVDEVTKVFGVGPATHEGIRDLVAVCPRP